MSKITPKKRSPPPLSCQRQKIEFVFTFKRHVIDVTLAQTEHVFRFK
jgi:hypothetical protein